MEFVKFFGPFGVFFIIYLFFRLALLPRLKPHNTTHFTLSNTKNTFFKCRINTTQALTINAGRAGRFPAC